MTLVLGWKLKSRVGLREIILTNAEFGLMEVIRVLR